jgi:spectinomycin phosphotransferase
VDNLHTKSWFGPRVEETFVGLSAAYGAARSLADTGLEFVVAPDVSAAGDVVCRLGEAQAMSVTAYVDGLTPGFGAQPGGGETSQLQQALAELHQATPPSGMRIEQLRDVVAEVTEGLRLYESHDAGPYSARLVEWLRDHAADLQQAVARLEMYASNALSERLVVTHGEPHWGNIIVTSNGLRLVDWDTIALAHAERDLWHISQDPNDLNEYAEQSGRSPQRVLLEFYALAWTLRDVVAYVHYFTRPHDDDAESTIAWDNVTNVVFT